MEVLLLTVFVSLVLAGLGVGSFVWSARSRTFEHSDRLSILPLQEEVVARSDVGRPTTCSSRGDGESR